VNGYKIFNVYLLLQYLAIWLSVGFCLFLIFFVITIGVKRGTNAVTHQLNPFRDYNNATSQGAHYFYLGDYDKAIKHYDEAITWALSIGNKSLAYGTYERRGNCYWAKGQLELALADFEQACHASPSTKAYDYRIKLCLYFAEKSVTDNNMLDAVNYYKRALSFDEHYLYEWKKKLYIQRRITIYKSRISSLPEKDYSDVIKADSIWLEINRDYLEGVVESNDNLNNTATTSIYASLDRVLDVSNAEWNYHQENYKHAIAYLENVVNREEYERIDQETLDKLKTLIQLLQSIENNSL
jgi:tetratricopeptide (TPR) repeat protein